jgi:hypothetical protein
LQDHEYTFALVEAQAKDKFRALWINANTTPEMNHLKSGGRLLLWPLSIFEGKSADSLKEPLIAGNVKMTKQENVGAAHKRFVLVKFNIMFYFVNQKAKEPKGVVNLEHYMLSPIEQPKKKLYVFRFEKVALSFAPRPKLYTFTFDDLELAQQWHRALIGECANRMGGTKLPPPRIEIDDVNLPPLFKKLPPPIDIPASFPVQDIDAPLSPYVAPVLGTNADNSMMAASDHRASVMFASAPQVSAASSGMPPPMGGPGGPAPGTGMPPPIAGGPAAPPGGGMPPPMAAGLGGGSSANNVGAFARSPMRAAPGGPPGGGMPPPVAGGMPPPVVAGGMPPPVAGVSGMPPPIAGGMPPPIAGAGGPPAPGRVPMRGGGAPPPMNTGMPRRDSPTRMPMPGGGGPPNLSTSGSLPPPIGAPAGAGVMPPPVGSGGPPIARRMRGREGAGAPAGFRAPAAAGRGPPPFPGMASSNDNILPPPPGGDEQSTSTGSIPDALMGGGGGSGGGTSDGESPSPVSPPGSAPLVPRRTSTTQDDNYAPIPHPAADDGSGGSGSSPAPPVAPRVGGSLTYSPRTGHRPDVSSRGMAPVRRANVQTMPAPRGSTPPPALRASARAPPARDPTRRAMSMAISTDIPPPEPDNGGGGGGSALPPPIGGGGNGALPPPIGGGNSALPPPIGGGGGGLPPPLGARPAAVPKADVVVALYAYDAPNATNDRGEYAISFGQGERLVLSERRDDGWYKGRNEAGQEGLIPGLYCKDE